MSYHFYIETITTDFFITTLIYLTDNKKDFEK